ncbi:putative hydrolase or acyltransferase of alpha/beta superfamily [Polaromonas sp. CF318]|uniref:alpha/beta fold hydrolase n=1 Tax=Polaromonas sp. CF318 TaxID=1144318 RepID=UPI0002713570|nr:alpha/beta hydrolase [Polaromonas sp. CF318]EJL84012.1 putative hydrolase or acyltransferase of alpha/beta superfamily [Polaromonas sp. CF318]
MSWVLLRGLTREARHWGDFAERLARALPGSASAATRVLALDLPGNGVFRRETSSATVGAMADFARGQLRARGLAPPYSLVAMSLGAMVAADWAQRYPQEIERLVLVNTSMRPLGRTSERLRPGNWLPLALVAARWSNAEHAERVIHRITCNRTTSLEQDIAAWTRIRQDAPVSIANAWRQLKAAAAFSMAVPPACPALVLSSSADHLVHPRCSARLAQAWQAAHHEHPWAGHDLPHDDADWVCRRIADWVDGG